MDQLKHHNVTDKPNEVNTVISHLAVLRLPHTHRFDIPLACEVSKWKVRWSACGVKTTDLVSLYRHPHDIGCEYSSPNIVRVIKSKRMRWVGHVALMGEGRGVYRVLVRKPVGRRPRRRWVDNIRMDLQEVGCEYVDWIGLAQHRDGWRMPVRAVMNLRVP